MTTVPRTTHNENRVRGTVRFQLRSRYGNVTLPRPTQEHGGLDLVRPGCSVHIDIGGARRIDEHTARVLAAAVGHAQQIEVTGTDTYGVDQTRRALQHCLCSEAAR